MLTHRIFLVPLLLFATMAGAAPGTDQTAQTRPDLPRINPLRDHAVPVPPVAIDLSCPLSSGFARKVDLSTGSAADWRVQGAALPPFARAYPIKPDAVPSAWNVPLGQAKWVKATPDLHPSLGIGQYVFKTQFRVLKSPGEMRVTLKGNILADEKFSVELIEPNLPGNPADHPSQGGANGDDPDPAHLKPHDVFDVDMLVGEATNQGTNSGSKNPRVGIYELQITVKNSAKYEKAVGMIAQLELNQTCLDWGTAKPNPKRKKKKK